MPPRTIPLLPDHFYHIYNRGVNKSPIFFSDRNYEYFIQRLEFYFNNFADVLAYCLMPNHFHLLIKVNSENFVDNSLRPFLVSYTKAISKEQNRVGPLFQGRFQAKEIESDENLLDCMRYIHLNPVTAGLVHIPEEWRFSSYKAYINPEERPLVNTSSILDYFSSISEFCEYNRAIVESKQVNKA